MQAIFTFSINYFTKCMNNYYQCMITFSHSHPLNSITRYMYLSSMFNTHIIDSFVSPSPQDDREAPTAFISHWPHSHR